MNDDNDMNNPSNDPNMFVKKRIEAEAITYTVEIKHFVSDGEWCMGLAIHDVASDERSRKSIAEDLRFAAGLVENEEITPQ